MNAEIDWTVAAEHGQAAYAEYLAVIVRRLHGLADRIQREGNSPTSNGLRTTNSDRYTRAAADVVHELTWGVANLNVSQLIYWAAHADLAGAQSDPTP